jgi:hypothetical protein
VAYATADGSAKAGKDYTAKTGTVTFGPGETSRQVTIAIAADTLKEGDESFAVTLSNAAGAALGAPRTETVTIQDRTLAGGKLKAKLLRLLGGVRFVIASDGASTYRYKLTLTKAQAKKLGLEKRTLSTRGKRTLRAGANTLSIPLGGRLKARVHGAKVKPTLTVTLGDGSTLRVRVTL